MMDFTDSVHVQKPLLPPSDVVVVGGNDVDEGLDVIPVWWKQITLRGLVVSAFLGAIFCVIMHKFIFTVGVFPALNVAAGLLAFFFMKAWTRLLSRLGIFGTPFTRQENTVIQTCVVACYGIAFSGGFGTYLLAMDETSFNLVGSSYSGNRAEDVKNPSLGWIIAFLFTVSFLGIFSVVPLQKMMIIDYGLTYPNGTATAVLISSFHTPNGATIAKFYFDFSPTYIGAGMLCPQIVNFSILLGAVLSWGILWPFIRSKAGYWYEEGLESTDFEGLYGYKVFIAVSVILGDGLDNIIKISIVTWKSTCTVNKKKRNLFRWSLCKVKIHFLREDCLMNYL